MKLYVCKSFFDEGKDNFEQFEFDLEKKPSISVVKPLDLDELDRSISPYGHVIHKCFSKVPRSGRLLRISYFLDSLKNPMARESWYFNADTVLLHFDPHQED